MKRWGMALGSLGMAALAVGPASAHHGYAGLGLVAGSFVYSTPLPGSLESCKPTRFDVALDAPAFPLVTPQGTTVVAVVVRGQGSGGCESSDIGGGLVAATIDAGPLQCNVRGAFTRVLVDMSLIIGGPCTVGEGDDAATVGSFNWVFELSWAADGHVVAGVATIDL